MAADDQPRNGLRLTHAVRPFPVVLPALPDELLSSWFQRHANFYGVSGGWLLRHCTLRHGRGVVAKSGFHPDCLRPTPTRICTQERSADHSEDDAVVRPKLPGCTDRDGSTNAGMQTLPRSSPSGVGDPGRSVAKLDGGLAPELPLIPAVRMIDSSPGRFPNRLEYDSLCVSRRFAGSATGWAGRSRSAVLSFRRRS